MTTLFVVLVLATSFVCRAFQLSSPFFFWPLFLKLYPVAIRLKCRFFFLESKKKRWFLKQDVSLVLLLLV